MKTHATENPSMSHSSGRLSLKDMAIVFLCENSWRFYTNACTSVTLQTENGQIVVPLVRGVGLHNLSFDHNNLNPTYKENWIRILFDAVYGYRSGTFVDVGVNIGKIIVGLMQKDATIPYVGFEPNLNCCFYIQQLLDANKLNHRVYPVGLSDHQQIVSLHMGDDFDVRGSIVSGFHEANDKISRSVIVDCGDRYLKDESVAVIKIDAEGSELPILRGLAQTIDRSRPVILCEILDYEGVADATASIRKAAAEGIARFLAERDYVLYRVTPERGLKQIDLQTLKQSLHKIENNYIAVPSGEQHQFEKGFHRRGDQ